MLGVSKAGCGHRYDGTTTQVLPFHHLMPPGTTGAIKNCILSVGRSAEAEIRKQFSNQQLKGSLEHGWLARDELTIFDLPKQWLRWGGWSRPSN